ncbi:MAG: hypothetical protein Crog4KO_36080 [Crocinitomicaceae bacterium]
MDLNDRNNNGSESRYCKERSKEPRAKKEQITNDTMAAFEEMMRKFVADDTATLNQNIRELRE